MDIGINRIKQAGPEDDSDNAPKKPEKGFFLWPKPRDEDLKRGPTEKQRLLFLEELGPEERCHYHDIDSVLFIGARRAGKTISATARVISYLMKNPKAVGLVGATNMPLLKRTALKEWGERFSEKVPWDMIGKPYCPIVRKPTQTDQTVVFKNGSVCHFMHLERPEVLRGMDLSIIHFEEAVLLGSEDAYRELILSLSGSGKPRQLILTTNPSAHGSWMDEIFKLEQLRPGYTGPIEPLVEPCECHRCEKCKIKKKLPRGVAPEYVDAVCPVCGAKKKSSCPGNQVWSRVIQTGTFDNIHVNEGFVSTMQDTLDEKNFSVFVEGSTEDTRDGFVYKGFSDKNIIHGTTCGIAVDRPVIIAADFNYEPQSWLMCQEFQTTDGFHINVLDEMIGWNHLVSTWAEELCQHPDLLAWQEATKGEQPVLLYGDPSGLYGTGNALQPSFYQIIHGVLEKHGFDVRIMMRKPQVNDSVLKEPVKIPVAGRVDALNEIIFKDGQIRLFINERCKNLIKSLKELRYADNGNDIDKSCDKRAKRATDKSKPFCMTHPTDALGYFVYKRFPVVKNRAGLQFWQVPGSPMVTITGGTIQERIASEAQLKRREEKEKAREERARLRARVESKKQDSMGNYLRSLGWDLPPRR